MNVKHFKIKEAHQKLKVLLLGSFAIAFALSLLTHSSIEPTTEGTQSSASRSTPLGKAKVSQKSSDLTQVILNDPAMKLQWGLKAIDLQSTSQNKNFLKGSRDIVVAIIDTGIDPTHPDLRNNLWVNPGEVGKDKFGRDKSTNGVDDDKNGFVDDVNGWNFVGNDHNLSDHHGHGTHIAGIIGAEGGNNIGVTGVASKVSLMVLKYYDPRAGGGNNLYNTVKAIEYAVKMNAQIINYSGGGLEKSSAESRAIAMARKKGILFVAAAGNEKSNSDLHGYYPADYEFNNIISVTAVDEETKNQFNGQKVGGQILESSNYGKVSVDIAAPGHKIYSTLPGGKYGYMTGTSQATAFVSGVAALIMANNRQLKAHQVIARLNETGPLKPNLIGKTRYGKILNSYRALSIKNSGLGVSDVVALNTSNIDHHTFSISEKNHDGLRDLQSLSQYIQNNNETAVQKIALAPPRKGATTTPKKSPSE